MTGSLKYEQGILIFSPQLKLPEEDVFQAPGLLNIIFEMTGSLKYELGILIFSSQLVFLHCIKDFMNLDAVQGVRVGERYI